MTMPFGGFSDYGVCNNSNWTIIFIRTNKYIRTNLPVFCWGFIGIFYRVQKNAEKYSRLLRD